MGEIIRVLIADDHAIVREGLRAVIGIEQDMELVGEATDGVEAVKQARQLQPDVIVMDLLMPNKDGVEAISDIMMENPRARILVLTSYTELDKILPTIKAGALGYVLKNSLPQELLTAIRDVNRGAVSLHPGIARQLSRGLTQMKQDPYEYEATLTLREVEILKLVARGLSNEEIAEQLVISTRTVGVHISHLLDKLHLNNRTQAALFALKRGFVGLFIE